MHDQTYRTPDLSRHHAFRLEQSPQGPLSAAMPLVSHGVDRPLHRKAAYGAGSLQIHLGRVSRSLRQIWAKLRASPAACPQMSTPCCECAI